MSEVREFAMKLVAELETKSNELSEKASIQEDAVERVTMASMALAYARVSVMVLHALSEESK